MRLTKKISKNIYASPSNEETEESEIEQQWKVCNKLGQLEDIEEQLGLDLIILFKALKSGVYYKHDFNNEIEYHKVRGIELQGLGVIDNLCSYGECDFTAFYKDYGKTWAFTKEELE